ncbi:MAG: hypothetical protein H0Z40_04970 [Desulfotomaculum sp.]|nr:hypothetical protein [Desulfotomaculum sp.]
MNASIIRLLASLVIGIIIGGSGMNMFFSKEFEELTAQNRALEEELRSARDDLEELEKQLEQQQKKKIITDIEPVVEVVNKDNLPSYEETSVVLDGEKKINQLLLPLKGQEIKSVDYNLIPRIVNGREFESEGRRYVLKAEVVVITDELRIYATAKLLNENE